MIKLKVGDKFYFSSMKELCQNIFSCKKYYNFTRFVPTPLKKTNYCVWCETLYENVDNCPIKKRWISTIDYENGDIIRHFGYNKEDITTYDVEFTNKNFLMFNKVKQKYFEFIGVYIEYDNIEIRGVFAGKIYKKISNVFSLK